MAVPWGVGESVPEGLVLPVGDGVPVGVLVCEPRETVGVAVGVPVPVKEVLQVGDEDCVVTESVHTVGVAVREGLPVSDADRVLRVAWVVVGETAERLSGQVEPVSVAEREGAVRVAVGGERVKDSVALTETEGVKLGEGVV